MIDALLIELGYMFWFNMGGAVLLGSDGYAGYVWLGYGSECDMIMLI